jgi:hypothetical protein
MSKPILLPSVGKLAVLQIREIKVDIQIFNKDTGAIKVPYFDERYN